MEVQALVTLVLIDGVTCQIVLPKNLVAIQAKQVLAIADEFGGAILPCKFSNIKPMGVEGLPFKINTNTEVNK